MGGTISIPDPVVGIERMASVVVYFSVESTIIFAVFAQVYRTFVATVQGCIENGFVVFTPSAYLDLA